MTIATESVAPHQPPWWANIFVEGWYHRFVDLENSIQCILIFGTYFKKGKIRESRFIFSIKTPDFHKEETWDFADNIEIKKDNINAYWIQSKQLNRNNEFILSETSCLIKTENIIFECQISEGHNWNTGINNIGKIKSWMSFLPKVVDWECFGINSKAKYSLKIINPSHTEINYEGNAILHKEKNWGSFFPKKWFYANGFNKDLHFVFTNVQFLNFIPLKIGIVYLWTPNKTYIFRSYMFNEKVKLTKNIKNSSMQFNLYCRNNLVELMICWELQIAPHFVIPAPKKEGWVERTGEYLVPELKIQIRKVNDKETSININLDHSIFEIGDLNNF